MMRGLPEMLSTITSVLPAWVVVVLVAVAAPFVVKRWLSWLRNKQIRGRLRSASFSKTSQDIKRFVDEAFELAGDEGDRLLALAHQAKVMHRPDIVLRVVAKLHDLEKHPMERRALREAVEKEEKTVGHPIEDFVVIERFLDEGMLVGARDRLTAALQRFPADSELVALRERLDAAEAAQST